MKYCIGQDEKWSARESFWIDQNSMACEDLKVADLSKDEIKDIIAAGRSSHNLRVYWNRTST